MPSVTPCLWFDDQAEEAVKFYVSVFPNSKVLRTSHYTDAGPRPAGGVLTVDFTIDGQEFQALNGGPEFKFSEAISFVVECKTQEEIDRYWDTLISGGGEPSQCGWLKDRFGLSWQVVPAKLNDMVADKDRARADRVMRALLDMAKLDMAALERAYEGA